MTRKIFNITSYMLHLGCKRKYISPITHKVWCIPKNIREIKNLTCNHRSTNGYINTILCFFNLLIATFVFEINSGCFVRFSKRCSFKNSAAREPPWPATIQINRRTILFLYPHKRRNYQRILQLHSDEKRKDS